MKRDILILSVNKGFNDNQSWITFIPYDYSKMFSKSDKFTGLKIFNLDKDYKIRVDKNLCNFLDVEDFLQKATIEYEIVESGTFHDFYKFKKLTIGNKIIDLTK